jgi:hypothetical protein
MFLTKTFLITCVILAGLLTSPPSAAGLNRIPEPARAKPCAVAFAQPNVRYRVARCSRPRLSAVTHNRTG